MAKYNVGDILEITEDFELEFAEYSSGGKYTVSEVRGLYYTLEDLDNNWDFSNTISKVDTHSGFRKVEPKVEFKVGDKVRLLEGAHGSPGYSTDTPEKVKERLAGKGLDYQTVFEVDQEVDSDGDVHVFHAESYVGLYLLPEFLVPCVEDEPVRMELGKTYQSTSNEFFYTPTEFNFEGERVEFDFVSDVGDFASTSHRHFYLIEEEFGVLPPVKPDTQEVDGVEIGGWDREEFASAETKPETVSVDALREAYEYVVLEYLDLDKLLALAKRLS